MQAGRTWPEVVMRAGAAGSDRSTCRWAEGCVGWVHDAQQSGRLGQQHGCRPCWQAPGGWWAGELARRLLWQVGQDRWPPAPPPTPASGATPLGPGPHRQHAVRALHHGLHHGAVRQVSSHQRGARHHVVGQHARQQGLRGRGEEGRRSKGQLSVVGQRKPRWALWTPRPLLLPPPTHAACTPPTAPCRRPRSPLPPPTLSASTSAGVRPREVRAAAKAASVGAKTVALKPGGSDGGHGGGGGSGVCGHRAMGMAAGRTAGQGRRLGAGPARSQRQGGRAGGQPRVARWLPARTAAGLTRVRQLALVQARGLQGLQTGSRRGGAPAGVRRVGTRPAQRGRARTACARTGALPTRPRSPTHSLAPPAAQRTANRVVVLGEVLATPTTLSACGG